MFLTIYSHFADLDIAMGQKDGLATWESPVWSGKVQIPDGEASLIERIFRFFNRVDDADSERLDDIGYNLPSLSVGDTVMFDGRIFYCAPIGWQEVGKPRITSEEIDRLFS